MQNLTQTATNSIYQMIGFAKQFYTLWNVVETPTSKSFSYVKNISISKEKVEKMYPGVEFSETLRGKHQSFSVLKSAGEATGEGHQFMTEHKTVEVGTNVYIDNMSVVNVYIGTTKYNKPYITIIGEDMQGFDRFFIPIFNLEGSVIPTVGDIIKVNGTISMYNDNNDLIYLKDTEYECITNNYSKYTNSVSGKINQKMTVVQFERGVIESRGYNTYVKKAGFVMFRAEDGSFVYVDTLISNYKTGRPEYKYEEWYDEFVCGAVFEVSGSASIDNGFSIVVRAKFNMIEKAEVSIKERTLRPVAKISEDRCKGKKKLGTTIYNIETSKYDEFVKYLLDIKNNTNAELYVDYKKYEGDDSVFELKDDARAYITKFITIDVKDTKETIYYECRFFFEA